MKPLFLILATGLVLLAGCAGHRAQLRVDSPYRDPSTLKKGEILHRATGRLLSHEELSRYLVRFPVVYVGEAHDSVDDHAVELEILRSLEGLRPGQVTLGLEMLRRPSQEQVDAFIRGDLDEKEFARVWQKNWGPRSFPYYREILEFARAKKIPVLALNAGDDLKKAVAEKGLEGLDPEMAARLPEMDLDDPYYREFVESMFAGHGKGRKNATAFFEVQVLWDETMAQTAAEYLMSPQGVGRQLVVFAGGNHVRYGFGIPRRLFRRLPRPFVIVSPYVVEAPQNQPEKFMDVDLPELPMAPADVYWAVGYRDLEDRRVMLGVEVEPGAAEGVLVRAVMPGSPAEKAGVEPQDRIVSVDGVPVADLFDLTYQVGLHSPGDTGPLVVLRGGERLTLSVTYEVVRHGR